MILETRDLCDGWDRVGRESPSYTTTERGLSDIWRSSQAFVFSHTDRRLRTSPGKNITVNGLSTGNTQTCSWHRCQHSGFPHTRVCSKTFYLSRRKHWKWEILFNRKSHTVHRKWERNSPKLPARVRVGEREREWPRAQRRRMGERRCLVGWVHMRLILLISAPAVHQALNINQNNVSVYTGPEGSYFGFSVDFLQISGQGWVGFQPYCTWLCALSHLGGPHTWGLLDSLLVCALHQQND